MVWTVTRIFYQAGLLKVGLAPAFALHNQIMVNSWNVTAAQQRPVLARHSFLNERRQVQGCFYKH